MNKLTIFALLVVFHVTVIREVMLVCQPLNQNLLKTFSDKVSGELLIWRGSFRYNFYCMKQCLDDLRCITVQYSESSGECRTYAADSAVVESSANTEHKGISTFQLAGRVGYGGKCLNNTECSVSNSECQSEGCFCQAGHRFNLATATCDFVNYDHSCSNNEQCNFDYPWCDNGVCHCQDRYLWDPITLHCATGCTKYGSSFQRYTGFSLAYNDVGSNTSATFSVNDCEDMCRRHTDCKSFGYLGNQRHCYLKKFTWHEAAIDDHRTRSDRVHGARLCTT